MSVDAQSKVNAGHLKRSAYLYARQSSLKQVLHHTESTQRQYALRRRAVALGWAAEHIIVIDAEQGQSGASAEDRAGFQQLVTEVGMGRAGIVMGLEVSRLARNNADWHRLLEICALTGTLILDEDGVYDPAHFNDRLLLGLKGTMSEAELHWLRMRLIGGMLNKARRGELRSPLPIGFVYEPPIAPYSIRTAKCSRRSGSSSRPFSAPARRWPPSNISGANGCASRVECTADRTRARWYGARSNIIEHCGYSTIRVTPERFSTGAAVSVRTANGATCGCRARNGSRWCAMRILATSAGQNSSGIKSGYARTPPCRAASGAAARRARARRCCKG
jgi:DNA invertase Pin-like site-specific DNA recombinase